MENILLCLLFAPLLLFAIFDRWIKNRGNHSIINRIPGPTALPLIENLCFLIRNRGDLLKIMTSLEQYGGIARLWILGQSKVYLFDKEYLKIFYSSNLLLKRSPEYHPLSLLLGNENQLNGDGESWKQAKKITSQTFQRISHETVQRAVNMVMQKMIKQLEQKESDGFLKCQQLLEDTQRSIVKIILYGEEFGTKEDFNRLIDYFITYSSILVLKATSPLHMFALTFPFTKEGRMNERIIKEFRHVVKTSICNLRKQLKALEEKCESIPDTYLHRLVSNYGYRSDDFLACQLQTMIAVSSETTSTSLGFILQMIAIHPHVQSKVYEEDRAIQEDRVGEFMEEPQIADLHKYKYLNVVIKETMRLYPVAPTHGRCAENDIQIGEFIVPKGTGVYISPYVTGRSEKYFKDPLKFNPDRFLSADSDQTFQYVFEPFHAGLRSCPGKKFALIVLKMRLISLVRRFQIFSKFNSVSELDDDVVGLFAFKQKGGILLRFVKRQKV